MTLFSVKIALLTIVFLFGCDRKQVSAPPAESPQAVESSKVAKIPAESVVKVHEGPLFAAMKDGKYGFIDKQGSFVIPPTFTYAKEFSGDLAAVYVGGNAYLAGSGASKPYVDYENGKWGYVDRMGKLKIEPQFGAAQAFKDGLALVTVGDGYDGGAGYIDTSGLFKVNPKFDFFRSSHFRNGVASVRLKDVKLPEFKDGALFDSGGRRLSEAQALSLMKEYERLSSGHWIDAKGEEIDRKTAFERIGVDREIIKKKSVIKILGSNVEVTRSGFKNSKGQVIVPAKYDHVEEFYSNSSLSTFKVTTACTATKWQLVAQNFAIIESAKCGLIDSDGNEIAPFDFDKIYVAIAAPDFAKFGIGCDTNRWVGCRPKKWGVYSIKDRRIGVHPQFDDISINGETIVVAVDGKCGYMDLKGQYILQPRFSAARPFVDGLAEVDFPQSYVDSSGRYVYRGSLGSIAAKAKDTQPTPERNLSGEAKAALTKKGTGTAFVVNKEGYAVTNHHVVGSCAEIKINGKNGPVDLVTSDSVNDLALIKIPGNVASFASISGESAKLRQGDDIVVFGFPLNSVLSSGGNLTPGVVSALTGLGNNTNQIQITAAIQPGSSGSPVLNRKGEVVGVVAMKLSDEKLANATGQVGQTVNFAISNQTLNSFLTTHKVERQSRSGAFNFDKSTTDLADEARKWTFVVECWR